MTSSVTKDKEVLKMFAPSGVAYKVVWVGRFGPRELVPVFRAFRNIKYEFGCKVHRFNNMPPDSSPLSYFHCFADIQGAKEYIVAVDKTPHSAVTAIIAVEYSGLAAIGNWEGNGVLLTEYVTPLSYVPIEISAPVVGRKKELVCGYA